MKAPAATSGAASTVSRVTMQPCVLQGWPGRCAAGDPGLLLPSRLPRGSPSVWHTMTPLRQRSSLKGSGGHPNSRLGPPPGGFGAAGLGWGLGTHVFNNECPTLVVLMVCSPQRLTAKVCLCLNKPNGQAPTPYSLGLSRASGTTDPATLLSPRVSCPYML